MFGRKKEITQKFIAETNEDQEEMITKDESKKDKNDNSAQSKNSDNNFIFYGSNNKFSKQLEIYATLKDSQEKIQKDKLVLIVVDSASSIELLSIKICESFSKYPEYQNLEGLRAINLTTINNEVNLPSEGKVEDCLRNGDIIYLDLISNEIWIKSVISMTNAINENSKLTVNMDIKIKNETTFRQLRYKLYKSGIMCFLDKCSKKGNIFHYIVSEIKISTSVHGNIDENKLKSIDDTIIKQIFNFKSSIKIEMKFFPLEFILFQRLKNLSIPKIPHKKNLWKKFRSINFRELLNNKKFIKEKNYIFDYFKKLFEKKDALPKFYIYSSEEDTNTAENSTEKISINIINNSESINIEELDNFKLNQSHNKSLFNWSEVDKTLENLNLSVIKAEHEKISLIILPPKNAFSEKTYTYSSKKNRYKKRKSTSKNTNMLFNDLEIGIISEENDDDLSDNTSSDGYNKKSRKVSDFNYNQNSYRPQNKLNFEILNKDDNEVDDEYNNLKIKFSDRKMSKDRKKNQSSIKRNLCEEFDKYFEKDKFFDDLHELYLIDIERGVLEKSTIPNFRNLKIEEKKIKMLNKRRKKKKYIDYSVVYQTIFSIKRLNLELVIISIFILGILIFFSHLLADTYY